MAKSMSFKRIFCCLIALLVIIAIKGSGCAKSGGLGQDLDTQQLP